MVASGIKKFDWVVDYSFKAMLLLLSFGSIPNFNDPLLRKKKEKKTVKQTFTKEIDELVSCASISNRKKHNSNLGKDQKGSLRQKRLQKPNKSIPFVKTKISDKTYHHHTPLPNHVGVF